MKNESTISASNSENHFGHRASICFAGADDFNRCGFRRISVRAAGIGAIAVLATVFPMLFIIRRKVKAGKWSDHDVSDAAERRNFYPLMIAILGFSLVIFYLLGFPRPLLVGMLISLAILTAAMLINHWSKISLHLTFAVYFAVSLLAVNYWMSGGLFVLAIAVGWSRIKLGRHTPAQVVSGALLGALPDHSAQSKRLFLNEQT